MENTGCEVLCGALATLAVKGQLGVRTLGNLGLWEHKPEGT